MTDKPETKTPEETKTTEPEAAEPVAGRTVGRLTAFDPADPASLETAMYDMSLAVRFVSQLFMGRDDTENFDNAGFQGLAVILECMADQVEAMEAAYAAMTGARTTGARKSGGG